MSTDITLRSKVKVKEDLTSKYILKRQTTMDNFTAIYFSTRSWIRSQSSEKGLISKYQWFWEIIKNELRLFWKAKWTRSKIHKKTLNHKIWSCFYSSLWITYDSDFFVCFHNQTRCKGYCRAQSQLNSFAMQFTNSLWHRLLHLLPEPSEVWSFFKLSYKISVTAFCHTLISHHLTWKVMQYFTKVWIIMCIKYLVLPNFRVFQVIHEPFLNIISNTLIILF